MLDKELVLKMLKNIQMHNGEDSFVRAKIIINCIESGELDLKEQLCCENVPTNDYPGKPELTDTERLDFAETNCLHISHNYTKKGSEFNVWGSINGNFKDKYASAIREAIDAAMRGKDGK